MARVAQLCGVLLAFLVLAAAGCSRTYVGPDFIEQVRGLDPAKFTCCWDPETTYPSELVDLAIPAMVALGPKVTTVSAEMRGDRDHPGKLTGKPEAVAAAQARIRPFDMIFIANKSQPLGRMVPGRFSHSYMYFGTEAELRALGLWGMPALKPHREAIRAGSTLAEAVAPVTRLTTLAGLLDVDGAVILRPALTAPQRRLALSQMFESLGTPYDFAFSIATPERLACTEFNALVYPHLNFKVREAYGNPVILPDDVVAQAIRGERMRVVAYLVGTDDGFDLRNVHSLMADIAAYWGLPEG